nr:MAG TPA_asm: hypothetical protein [Caudoviricetes sp.]
MSRPPFQLRKRRWFYPLQCRRTLSFPKDRLSRLRYYQQH